LGRSPGLVWFVPTPKEISAANLRDKIPNFKLQNPKKFQTSNFKGSSLRIYFLFQGNEKTIWGEAPVFFGLSLPPEISEANLPTLHD